MQIKQETGIGPVGRSYGFVCWFKLANKLEDNQTLFWQSWSVVWKNKKNTDPDHLIIVWWKKWGKDVSIAVSIMSLFASLLIPRSSRDILKGAFIKQLHLTLYFHKRHPTLNVKQLMKQIPVLINFKPKAKLKNQLQWLTLSQASILFWLPDSKLVHKRNRLHDVLSLLGGGARSWFRPCRSSTFWTTA